MAPWGEQSLWQALGCEGCGNRGRFTGVVVAVALVGVVVAVALVGVSEVWFCLLL